MTQTGKAPTGADIILQALRALGPGWHTSREVMWQVRRDGYQMTTARARGIARHLYRAGEVHMLAYGGRYSFKAKP
jgi:hypothetical protein